MKTFTASDMAHKRSEIFEAASDKGAVIQRKNTNGEVFGEYVLIKADDWNKLTGDMKDIANQLKGTVKV